MKCLFVLIVLCVAVWLSGCGLADTENQRKLRYKHVVDANTRMLIDDWDHFWLMDRPSKLTHWHVRDRD